MDALTTETWAIAAALVFMMLDIISGVGGAFMRGALKSTKIREGLYRKASLAFLIVVASMIELFSEHVELGFTVPLVVPICVVLVGMEVVSILENICKVNPDLKATKLLDLFKVGKDGE